MFMYVKLFGPGTVVVVVVRVVVTVFEKCLRFFLICNGL